ncbi:MAG: group III truncated hemoglobin [Putridiphycobacter sp.]|nr:group III truncated hemoglobin [Putridiphycobacter sp.]
MKAIETRADIYKLVDQFYMRIRKDDLLGPIFNKHIPEDSWPSHLQKLTDFWETNLFGIPKFKGNPTQAHRNVDTDSNYTISQKHFGQWLHLWFTTLDSLFFGELADRAKMAARKMGTGQFLALFSARPETVK